MKSHLIPQITKFNSRWASRGVPILAALLVATQLTAQNPVSQDSANPDRPASGSQPIAAAPSAPPPIGISAPAPAQEEANLPSHEGIPFLAIAAGREIPQSSSQNAPATATSTVTKTKPAHHGLGVTLAVVGTAALVSGVALYVGEQHAYCNSSSSGCNEAKNFGLALMPIGAGVAVTGFYLQFHR